MPSIRVERLELTVRGIDPATVRAALGALPAALSAEIARGGGAGAEGATVRLGSAPGAEALARGLAARVAAEVRARRGNGGGGG